jgi:hypothetical protein
MFIDDDLTLEYAALPYKLKNTISMTGKRTVSQGYDFLKQSN